MDDLLQRQWLVAEDGDDDDDTPHLRIVQWNILADGKLFILFILILLYISSSNY